MAPLDVNSSSSTLHSMVNLDSAMGTRQLQTAVVASASAVLLASIVIPAVLPARYTIWGVHSLRDILTGLWSSKAHRKISKQHALERWIHDEKKYAWKRLLMNIQPTEECDKGCVVASPSKKDPNYFYQWSRDSAMVFKVVIEYWKRDLDDTGTAKQLILDFINETKKMQRMDTPSGGFKTGGLGEVKFEVDGRPFTGSWGRPQNDGPALRASALINFATELLDTASPANRQEVERFIRNELYDSLPWEETQSVIKADLDYISRAWDELNFELWEEVKGKHHFNMLVTIRALLDGAAFAKRLGDDKSAQGYEETVKKIEASLGRFWDKERQYLVSSVEVVNDHGKHTWLDTANVLGFNHAGDLSHRGDMDDYLGSDKSLLTIHAIGESMRSGYSLNTKYYPKHSSKDQSHQGYALGRYVEDVYDGDGVIKTGVGNPWYLCTLAHAEFYYRLIYHFRSRPISIDKTNAVFYMHLDYFNGKEDLELLSVGQTYKPQSREHDDLLEAFKYKGDSFVNVVKDWAKWDGGLWEQFDRNNGRHLGAPHLTWSYASFLSCMAAREGKPMFH